MPNTLAHIGVNVLFCRPLFNKPDGFLIIIGALIPDVPWILQRIVAFLVPTIDSYDLRLYFVVQASLLFSVVLCFAVANLSSNVNKSFLILVFGTVIHLLMDSLETKWANGIHLFAPINWKLLNFEIFWPEHFVVHLLSILGIISLIYLWKYDIHKKFCSIEKRKVVFFILLILTYFILPFIFMSDSEAADNHFVKTLRNYDQRTGKYFEIDRGFYLNYNEGDKYKTSFGDIFNVKNLDLDFSGSMSIKAIFISPKEIFIIDYHVHGNRDLYSYIGLLMVFSVFLIKLYNTYLFKRRI